MEVQEHFCLQYKHWYTGSKLYEPSVIDALNITEEDLAVLHSPLRMLDNEGKKMANVVYEKLFSYNTEQKRLDKENEQRLP